MDSPDLIYYLAGAFLASMTAEFLLKRFIAAIGGFVDAGF